MGFGAVAHTEQRERERESKVGVRKVRRVFIDYRVEREWKQDTAVAHMPCDPLVLALTNKTLLVFCFVYSVSVSLCLSWWCPNC